jgi:predicted Zn finger-like uncharacterized protein
MVITVQCPSCQTSFPVDTQKVPEAGVHARCSTCQGVFFVERPPEPLAVEPVGASIQGGEMASEPAASVEVGGTSIGEETPEGFAAPAVQEPSGEAPPVWEAPPSAWEAAPSLESETPSVPTPESPLAEAESVAEPTFEIGTGDGHDAAAAPVELATPPPPPVPEPAPAATPSSFSFGRRDPHEKARRLARVLVSDMIMYNPERHSRALESGSLKSDFDEEIKKSWQEYVDQVGDEIAGSTNYFNDALNDLLAKGQSLFP